ncbi:TatD family hydrolase [Bacteroides heparinolyticus]|uniref:TatD family hydrolase n=1 Tax=Prevotella heparinolytica TaxID=28113 RepID=UPI00359F7293
MNIPIDIHTHRLPQTSGKGIVNCEPATFLPQKEGWYSVGIHPWSITAPYACRNNSPTPNLIVSERMNRLETQVCHPLVLAVGEAGLDKLADAPMTLQLEVFERQARLAMEADKPLVIHLVRATDELLALKHTLRPTNPWIIHGFRGKAALAEEYLRHGFFLSFGEKYREEALRLMPAHRLFIETDESDVSIDELYARAAAVRGVPSSELKNSVEENVIKLFFKQ